MNQHDNNWEEKAHIDVAEREAIQCKVCKVIGRIDEAISIWRNGKIVFAVCDNCNAANHFLMTPTERGIEIRVKSKEPYLIKGWS